MPFQPGHKLAKGGRRVGAGRKPEQWKELFNRALTKATTEEDLEQVLNTLRDRAKSGDSRAAALYLGYVVGKPIERQEISGPDGKPMEHSFVDFGECTDQELKVRLAAASGIAVTGSVQEEP